MSRNRSKRVNSILKLFPDTGKAVESFVADSNIGADAWRRTGMLTFDGNLKLDKKVTYEPAPTRKIQPSLRLRNSCPTVCGKEQK